MNLTTAEAETLMREALAEADRGMSEGEGPIGCVLARRANGTDGQMTILARGHNRVRALARWTAHAEMVTFEKGGLPLDADDIVMVSTLEPCVMCLGAAMESKIALVVFGLRAPADSGTGRVKPPESPDTRAPRIVGGVLAKESRQRFEQYVKGREGTDEAKYAQQLLALTKAD